MKISILLLALYPGILFAQWSTASLSEAKLYVQAAASSGKAFFVGGLNAQEFLPSDKIEIYDFASNQMAVKHMKTARIMAGVVATDNLLFIAGGLNPLKCEYYNVVEIYDIKNDSLKPAQHLSSARAGIAAVRVGQELWFGGGFKIGIAGKSLICTDTIDIYNLDTEEWSIRRLSVPRFCSGASLGNKVVFAGGIGYSNTFNNVHNFESATVDIFDIQTEDHGTTQLSLARFNTAMTAAGAYIIVAGGSTMTLGASDVVDLWNTQTGEWTTANLSMPRSQMGAATVCNTKAVFAGGGETSWGTQTISSSDRVDIFDAADNQWTQAKLVTARSAAFAAADEEHFFLGGGWHPEANEILNSAEFYNCTGSRAASDRTEALSQYSQAQYSDLANDAGGSAILQISPNPVRDYLQIIFSGNERPFDVQLFEMTGRRVKRITATTGESISFQEVLPGPYLLYAIAEDGRRAIKLILKQ